MRMKPVSCGIAMFGWLSSISRSSVLPAPIGLTMKIGPRASAGSRAGASMRRRPGGTRADYRSRRRGGLTGLRAAPAGERSPRPAAARARRRAARGPAAVDHAASRRVALVLHPRDRAALRHSAVGEVADPRREDLLERRPLGA